MTAFANLNRQPVDLALAEIVLRDLIPTEGGEITSATIMAQTASYFGLTLDDLRGSSRSRVLVNARRSRCTCAASSPRCPCPRSARNSTKDHTTVMHANKEDRPVDGRGGAIYNNVTELTGRIKQQSR